MVVGKVIRDYMEGGAKKLTVPGFGTFMRREGAQGGSDIIFVDLLRVDDSNTLSEMVEDRGSLSELEAMAMIDRFIFETRNAVERNGSATIAGFGTLTVDHKGVYKFAHSPTARPTKETAVQESLFERGESGARPSTKAEGGGAKSPEVRHVATQAPKEDRPIRRPATPGVRPVAKKRSPSNKPSPMDTILIVAIIAAAIALVALVFGMSSGNMPFLSK